MQENDFQLKNMKQNRFRKNNPNNQLCRWRVVQ